jgi:Ca2+/Na+ antiporter
MRNFIIVLMNVFKRVRYNSVDSKTFFRTLGALLLGNSVVIPVLRNFQPSYWWVLCILGVLCFVLTSFSLTKRGE